MIDFENKNGYFAKGICRICESDVLGGKSTWLYDNIDKEIDL